MGWQTVKYACGHGEHQVQLYGKQSDRDNKAEWYERNVVCPECFKKQKQEEDANAEKTIRFEYEPERESLVVRCIAQGQREANKDALLELGFKWRKVEKGTDWKPFSAWELVFDFAFRDEDELFRKFQGLVAKCGKLGYTLKDDDRYSFALTYEDRILPDLKEYKQYVSTKPSPEGCFDFMVDKHGEDYYKKWNGKIYGRPGGYNYYVDGEKFSCTDAQRDAITKYQSAMEQWRKENDMKNVSTQTKFPANINKWAEVSKSIEEALENI